MEEQWPTLEPAADGLPEPVRKLYDFLERNPDVVAHVQEAIKPIEPVRYKYDEPIIPMSQVPIETTKLFGETQEYPRIDDSFVQEPTPIPLPKAFEEPSIKPIMPEELSLPPEQPPHTEGRDEILGRLAMLNSGYKELKDQINETAEIARDSGITWREIAEAVDITPQSAYQRWSERGREKHRIYQRKRLKELE